MSSTPIVPSGRCPICDADDAYLGQRADSGDFFVECINCGVYVATRKAFRHFEYLRSRSEAPGLQRLDGLAAYLKGRARGIRARLEYDTWYELLDTKPSQPT